MIDADACPVAIREIVVRAASRARVPTTFIANQWIRLPASRFLRALQVAGGLDAADDAIVEHVQAGDLVVRQDIPLAARVIERGAQAVHARGERFTADAIGERLSIRNFMEELRGAGVPTGGPPPLHLRDRQAFAAVLDAWLARRPQAPSIARGRAVHPRALNLPAVRRAPSTHREPRP